MTEELDRLAQELNRLIEQERFAEAQALTPEYTRELDRVLRTGGGAEILKQAIDTFHAALAKARIARAHMVAELVDVSRARAYTGEAVKTEARWELFG